MSKIKPRIKLKTRKTLRGKFRKTSKLKDMNTTEENKWDEKVNKLYPELTE